MELVIGFGGNVGDVASAFAAARAELGSRGRVIQSSGLYRTRAVGPERQPDFLNATVLLTWPGPPGQLLDVCLDLERRAGRVRRAGERWAPRTLDLDLLLADGLVCRGPRLALPHPRLAQRGFALLPAADVAPDWVIPGDGRSLRQLADERVTGDPTGVERLAERW